MARQSLAIDAIWKSAIVSRPPATYVRQARCALSTVAYFNRSANLWLQGLAVGEVRFPNVALTTCLENRTERQQPDR